MRTFFRLLPALVLLLIASASHAEEKDYAIKLTRPPKVGQKYTIVAEGAMTQTATILVGGKKFGDDPEPSEFGVRLEGACEVLEVNPDGEEAKVACTVKKCMRITKDGDAELVPAGRVITATGGKEDTTFKLDQGELSPEAIEALDLVLRMGENDGYNDDKIYGTTKRQPVGGSWEIDAKAAAEEAKADEVVFDPKDITASLKLEKLESIEGVECMRIAGTTEIKKLKTKAPENMTYVRGALKAKYAALYPVDTNVGAMSESMSVTHTATFRGEKGLGGEAPTVESKVQRAVDVKRKYLP